MTVGPVIALYYVSAGALLFAAGHAAILAPGSGRVRTSWFHAALAFDFALFQIFCALQCSASDLVLAVEAHKWLCAASFAVSPLLLFLLYSFRPESRRAKVPWIFTGLAVLLAVAGFLTPYGLRFAALDGTRLVTLPWGEQMRILSGPPLPGAVAIGLLPLALIAFGAGEARHILRQGERFAGTLFALGGGLMLVTTTLAGLADRGAVGLPYLGGFVYLALLFSVGFLVNRQFAEIREARQRMADLLVAEIGSHTATHDRMRHAQHHDPLTHLPNRGGLIERLNRLLEDRQQHRLPLSVLLLDIDRFDMINGTFGAKAGDQLLTGLARRLQEQMRPGDFVARLGGDEFVVVAGGLGAAGSVGVLFENLPKAASLSFVVDGEAIDVTLGIGVATYPEDGDTVLELLARADIALREAKRRGRGQIQFFQPELGRIVHEKLRLGTDLRGALVAGQFELHYQPQIDAADGRRRPVCMEALLRWRHPVEGMIPPDRFIPAAEEMHLMAGIGDWVVEEACRSLAAWRRAGPYPNRVAVNLSIAQLLQPDLVDKVSRTLSRFGLKPGNLEFEITETQLMTDPGKCAAQFEKLGELGIRLSIDDFGTGYSSLSYLKLLPIHAVKIDRTFVQDIGSNGKGAAICAASVGLAANLRIGSVAEGVETEAQAARLRELGCELLQGYLFAPPLPAEAAADYLLKAAAGPAVRGGFPEAIRT